MTPYTAKRIFLSCALTLAASFSPAIAAEISQQQAAQNLAGLAASNAATITDSVQKTYRHRVDAAWAKYNTRIGLPLQDWTKREVAYVGGGTVFYPFSGPDFPTVARMYPQAERYVLVAMQNARRPAYPENMNPQQRREFLEKFGAAWEKFGTLGFFRTEDLDDDQKGKATSIGVSSLLLAFAARLGYEVKDIAPLEFDAEKGEWTPRPSGEHWRSVRLSLRKDGRDTTLDYLRMDLSDAGLKASAPQRAWIERMAGKPTLLKAASHLLQEPYFAMLRDALVQAAPLLVQDETGLNYNDLRKIGAVRLYGNFSQTYGLFKKTTQRALAAAYQAEKSPGELPFAFSYLKKTDARSIQIARRSIPK